MRLQRRFAFFFSFILAAAGIVAASVGGVSIIQARDASQRGAYQTAARSYLRAARIFFWRDDLWEQAAFVMLKHGDLPSAIYYLEQADRSSQGQISLAYAYYQIGNLSAAADSFRAGAEEYHTPQFYEGLALVYRAQKNWDEERRALENQIQLDVGNALAHYRLGVLLSVLDSQLALPELIRASSLDPEFDPAVQTLRTALNLSAAQPDASRQMVNVGRALGLIKEWNLARTAFERALELDEKNPEAWAWLGEAKQHQDESGSAELDRALELNPFSPVVRALRGLQWSRQGNDSQALAEYLLAAESDPNNPAWRASLGEAYFKKGDLISALDSYRHAVELAPEEAEYQRLLALFCVENGVDVESVALPAAQKAAELAPDNPQVLDALGYVYFSTGRYANAEKILSDLTKRFPHYYAAHLHLSMNYLSQGNSAAAYASLVYVRDADAGGEDGALAKKLLAKYFP